MKAIVQSEAGDPSVLHFERNYRRPALPTGRDLLVRIHATALNPIDYRMRRQSPDSEEKVRILGWDASGIVEHAGPDCEFYQSGDDVYFAGSLKRPGAYAEYTVVDERLVGRKPSSLNHVEAAGLSLVSLTAWESLVEKLGWQPGDPRHAQRSLLIVNGAGGVGSMAVQLASRLLKVGRIVATAGRPETKAWCFQMGATEVIDHHGDLRDQLKNVGGEVDAMFICYDGAKYIRLAGDLVKPLGHVVSICPLEDEQMAFAQQSCFYKGLQFSWELMFTKSLYGLHMESQRAILNRIAEEVDEQVLQSIVTRTIPFQLDAVQTAHLQLEASTFIGKTTIDLTDIPLE